MFQSLFRANDALFQCHLKLYFDSFDVYLSLKNQTTDKILCHKYQLKKESVLNCGEWSKP